MTTLNTDLKRPRLRPDIVIHKLQEVPAQAMVEDPRTGRTFVLREQERIVVEHFDGRLSFEQVAESVSNKLGIRLSASSVAKFAERLDKLGLLEPDIPIEQESTIQTSPESSGRGIELKLASWSRQLQPIASLFFSLKSGWFIFVAVCFLLSSAIMSQDQSYIRNLRIFLDLPYVWVTILLIYLFQPLRVFIHELGHAMATAQYTGRFTALHISTMLLSGSVTPSTTALWNIKSRGQRTLIALAGIYFQIVFLAIIVTLWRYVDSSTFWNLVFVSLCIPLVWSTITNILPSLPGLPHYKTDGYFALSYLVGLPNLATRSQKYIHWLSARNRSSHAPTWLPELTMAQKVVLVVYPVIPWLGLLVLTIGFLGISRYSLNYIPSTGVALTLVAALWGFGPYLQVISEAVRKSLWKGGSL